MENNNIEKNTNIEDNSNLEDKKNSKKMKPRTKKILSNVFLFSSLAAAFLCVTIIPFALNKKINQKRTKYFFDHDIADSHTKKDLLEFNSKELIADKEYEYFISEHELNMSSSILDLNEKELVRAKGWNEIKPPLVRISQDVSFFNKTFEAFYLNNSKYAKNHPRELNEKISGVNFEFGEFDYLTFLNEYYTSFYNDQVNENDPAKKDKQVKELTKKQLTIDKFNYLDKIISTFVFVVNKNNKSYYIDLKNNFKAIVAKKSIDELKTYINATMQQFSNKYKGKKITYTLEKAIFKYKGKMDADFSKIESLSFDLDIKFKINIE